MNKAIQLLLIGTSGVLLAFLKFFYMLLPWYYLTDLIVFGFAGFMVASLCRLSILAKILAVVLPTFLMIFAIVLLVGLDGFADGVGIAWPISTLTVLCGAVAGTYTGSSLAAKRRIGHEH